MKKFWKVLSFDLDKAQLQAEINGTKLTKEDYLASVLNMYENFGANILNVFFADGRYQIIYNFEIEETFDFNAEEAYCDTAKSDENDLLEKVSKVINKKYKN